MKFSDAFEFIEEGTKSLSIRRTHADKFQNKRLWKSLRKHILSCREKRKQAEADAGVLRKKKFLEQQKLQENKLTIAQINYRLSELQDKRVKLEEEKQALLSQAKNTNNNLLLYLPAIEATCERNILATNNIKISTVSDAILIQQQQIIIYNNTQSYVIPPIDELSSLEPHSVSLPDIFNEECKSP